jgi:hypothetical protein
MIGDEPPAWLGRVILHDELRGLGLPWCPDACWRRPPDAWLTMSDTLEAVALSVALVRAIRRRGIPCGDELRDAAWRCTVAGLGRLPRDRWPTRRQADDHDEPDDPGAPCVPDDPNDPDEPGEQPAGRPEPADEPLVIRRREGGRPHAK